MPTVSPQCVCGAHANSGCRAQAIFGCPNDMSQYTWRCDACDGSMTKDFNDIINTSIIEVLQVL